MRISSWAPASPQGITQPQLTYLLAYINAYDMERLGRVSLRDLKIATMAVRAHIVAAPVAAAHTPAPAYGPPPPHGAMAQRDPVPYVPPSVRPPYVPPAAVGRRGAPPLSARGRGGGHSARGVSPRAGGGRHFFVRRVTDAAEVWELEEINWQASRPQPPTPSQTHQVW